MLRRLPLVLVCWSAVGLGLIAAACAAPPTREMNQAQGAIDAARAAGSAEYAVPEFTEAVQLLQRSEQAVSQRDYRLALSLAMDSRERAQAAARSAADARAKARGHAERTMTEVNIRLIQAGERLQDPALARLPRRVIEQHSAALAAAGRTMQEAGAALGRDDYNGAVAHAKAVSEQLSTTIAAIEQELAAPAGRRRR